MNTPSYPYISKAVHDALLLAALADERERCAKIAEAGAHGPGMSSLSEEHWTAVAAKEIAAAIRRGK